ncbi:unnamed protein product [Strongylus vulgaris]|uniref:Receptor ligand binding region domain-containing protein n=1 Tax=Strongylus vulgaris TaxID=40348 RepID=A0A3P7LH91_STRVU|nr:unnamed protein product [Strongylus vulgaris]
MKQRDVDVVIGPPCPMSAEIMAYLSTYYKKTMLGWGFLIDSLFIVNYTECDGSTAVGVAVEFMKQRDIDVVIGPPCPMSAEIMAYLSTHYKKTMLGWGFLIDSLFSNAKKFPYITKVIPDSLS